MGRIQILPDEVINKIAAGEVVERPASVVKELVENALDAGATSLEIHLEDGGTRNILVRDNGSGISPEDCTKTIIRHATSKIRQVDDLYSINSLGFRGEALAAISSVSKFSLNTRVPGSKEGSRLEFDSGNSPMLRPWNGADGTQIQVSELFYNIPVRSKFLKSPQAEFAACLEYIQAMILARPDVGFALFHNQKEKIRVFGADPSTLSEDPRYYEQVLRQRIKEIFGEDFAKEAIFAESQAPWGRVTGFLSPPGLEKATSQYMYYFVNGRWVKDKTLRYGVMRGYHSHLLKGKYPQVVVFLSLDPSLVDVNVHPAKTELRFQYDSDVQTLIAQCIRTGLRGTTPPAPLPEPVQYARAQPQQNYAPQPPNRSFPSFELFTSSRTDEREAPLHRGHAETVYQAPAPIKPSQSPGLISTSQMLNWSEMRFIGSFQKCYLLFENGAKLLVVDQHAWHERILYERLCVDKEFLQTSQPLMIPEAVRLTPEQVIALGEKAEELNKLGFRYQAISQTEVEIRSVPVFLSKKNLPKLIEELASSHTTHAHETDTGHHVISTIACHGAVRAGEELDQGDLTLLISQANQVDFYHNCPHGRRVFKWFEKSDVGGWFDRV